MTFLDKCIIVGVSVGVSLVAIELIRMLRNEQEFEYDENWFGDMPFCSRWRKR